MVSVGIVTTVRDDGSYEVTFPQTHVLIDKNGQPVNEWKDNVHSTPLVKRPYEIEKPLMPIPAIPAADETGEDGNG